MNLVRDLTKTRLLVASLIRNSSYYAARGAHSGAGGCLKNVVRSKSSSSIDEVLKKCTFNLLNRANLLKSSYLLHTLKSNTISSSVLFR